MVAIGWRLTDFSGMILIYRDVAKMTLTITPRPVDVTTDVKTCTDDRVDRGAGP